MLTLVDGPRDMRFFITAAAVSNQRANRSQSIEELLDEVIGGKGGSSGHLQRGLHEITERNIKKLLKFRDEEGKKEFVKLVQHFDEANGREQAERGAVTIGEIDTQLPESRPNAR
jgi:hypothetical protein